MSDAQVPKKEVTDELVLSHYQSMSMAIVMAVAKSGMSLDVAVSRAVSIFGMVPTAADNRVYEIHPKLRAKLDDAADQMGEPRLPTTFTEDQAVMFCAVQTATLQVEGKLGELEAELKQKNEELKAQIEAKLGKGATSAIDKGRVAPAGENVVPFPGKGAKGFDDDGDNGPTFH